MSQTQIKQLLELSALELEEIIGQLGEKRFRAGQIWEWIYKKGALSFSQMHNVPKKLKEELQPQYILRSSKVKVDTISKDGTRKWLLSLLDGSCGNEVETVYIPETTRGTLCISSQVGCTLNCTFCHTGTQALVKNLTSAEILSQVLQAKDMLSDWDSGIDKNKITNVVFMGMGEPLLNYENVKQAALRMLDPKQGLGLSKRKVTISTSGIVPKMKQCADDLGIRLAVSLHAPTDELRDQIVPINRKYPLKELIQACKYYASVTGGRQITFEYVMLKGVNDDLEHAKKLIELVKGIPSKFNLIPFNPWPGTIYQRSSGSQIKKFSEYIESNGIEAPVRVPRGDDILAACGQLKSETQKQRKSFLRA